jgi:hypothetical protein
MSSWNETQIVEKFAEDTAHSNRYQLSVQDHINHFNSITIQISEINQKRREHSNTFSRLPITSTILAEHRSNRENRDVLMAKYSAVRVKWNRLSIHILKTCLKCCKDQSSSKAEKKGGNEK